MNILKYLFKKGPKEQEVVQDRNEELLYQKDSFYAIKDRVENISIEDLLDVLTSTSYLYQHVFLFDINMESKPPVFWRTLGQTSLHFHNDVVIFNCKDSTEAVSIVSSIDRSFARAIAYSSSQVVADNEW